jgi:hypothetical protein
MFTIKLDQARNLIVIRYSGHVGPDETGRCAEEVRLVLEKVKPGFRLLADLTDLQSMEVSCAPHIKNIMEMCNQNGVTEVVRVIPDPKRDIGLQIMSYFHYRADVHITTCTNLDEAMKATANPD